MGGLGQLAHAPAHQGTLASRRCVLDNVARCTAWLCMVFALSKCFGNGLFWGDCSWDACPPNWFVPVPCLQSAGMMVDVRPWPKAFRPPPQLPHAVSAWAAPHASSNRNPRSPEASAHLTPSLFRARAQSRARSWHCR